MLPRACLPFIQSDSEGGTIQSNIELTPGFLKKCWHQHFKRKSINSLKSL